MTETLTREAAAVGSDRLADYLDRVRSITPLIRSEAQAIERDRTVTKPVADALFENGIFHMLVPTDLGGGGLLPSEGMRVYEELSKADASVGWSVMASSWATAMVLGYLEPEAARELVNQPGGFVLAGQLLPRYPAVQTGDGFIVDGEFSFASGSDHATWIGAGILLAGEDGKPVLDENGNPKPRVALLPKDQVELKNNWDVWGLAGTGSHDYRITKKFVPMRYSIPTFGGTAYRPEPMYQLGNELLGGLCHAPVVLGIATRALELVAAMSANKVRPNYGVPVGQADIFRIDFARHEATLQAARLYCYDLIESAEAKVAAGGSATAEDIARVQQMLAWIHEVTDDMVSFAHKWGGSRSIASTSELGRYVRDMRVATQHLLVDPKGLVDAAAVLLPIYEKAGA
ncbi:acyl-CoA dehydrogenase family protein [Mycolicibacterium elephantis]|uniref:Acyl-CoA dehydrogenase n=1 Tax=Mycolicibacterium elephantis DSM 44368 TaxID=1335622 RepID=A0A439DMW0_9MYCO|nr:acyl-CoA dehydrogenase family protein [Mycolicibacterium elephantis]MCV7220312.1 acyl-CoA dehydrogenase family protein [Mycolicibacterium elephantis]RWA16406.1 hypothetical protein MELE44368_07275 [Mycolicibacterium elephantis DSM 44368]